MIRFNQSGLLFFPKRWQRALVVNWLKRIHAWTGFWGALLFLLMGTSGFLLNHRATLKIGTGKPHEVSSMNVVVPSGTIVDEDALGRWAKATLGLKVEPKALRAEGKGRDEPRFMGRKLEEAPRWTRVFNLPDGRLIVDYVPGSTFVTAKREQDNVLNFIKNLHKGTGLGVGWVLFLDTIAGALVAMSLTGFLLWSRLHGSRLLAGGIVAVSLGLAVSGVVPFLL